MEESKSILHELYVYSEWKPEPEYIQKPDGLLPENISALWRWIKFLGPKKSLIDSVTAHKERQQKWHIALGDEGKVIAILTDNILEIRTKRSDYATIAARTTVSRDAYAQWRKLVWSPDCAFVVLAYGNGVVSFFDLTASNLFNIPIECSRPGGLECTDNTHAVADIIFMPLRVNDTKWSWKVLIVNYDGKVRGYLVSQMDGFTLHHTNTFSGGISCVAYCDLHATLYVAGVPRGSHKDRDAPHGAGLTAWRVLDDEPHYTLSVVSDQLEGQANDKFQLYIPFVSAKNLAFIVQMVLSPDNNKIVCLHCNGDISVWRLPLLKLLHRFPLASQPGHDLRNPLVAEEKVAKKDMQAFHAADVNWWSNEEVILSRYSGAVSVCGARDLLNLLGKRAEFFQGAPRVTRAHHGAFMALECETSVLPAKRSSSDETMEVVKVEEDVDDNVFDLVKELFKTVLYAFTDIETFQPKPRRITCVSRVYRLLAVKSTTPTELFSRKIESGNYSEALTLAETFNLDSDLVYQQQWRKNPVSTDAIQKYLSKVSKKIWAVHQCVDRLPETLPAAKELLQFGLELTNEEILEEINKEREDTDQITDPEDIVPEHLHAYTSELLRCRHVMLFYKERLCLYETILKYEKSTYVKDEYDRLRSNSVMHSSMEIAKEGRIEALTCLWPHIKTTAMKLAVLEKLPETINPMEYQHLLPTKTPMQYIEHEPIEIPETKFEPDWCRKQIFRSIWSSNWSEETTPDTDSNYNISDSTDNIAPWYEQRAREIEERSGLASYALHLVTLATIGGGVEGLHDCMFNLLTLNTLIYDVNLEGVTLKDVEKWTLLETCSAMMKLSTAETFVSDLKAFVMPFLKRTEVMKKQPDASYNGLLDYLESISVEDLAPILLLLKSEEYKLDVRTHLVVVERCLFAYTGTDQLEMACDLLDTILRETDGTIGESELVRRVSELERLVCGSSKLSWRGVRAAPRDLRDTRHDRKHAAMLLTRLARDLPNSGTKPVQAEWEKLLKDILDLQATLFNCVSIEECYEIYASALMTSGDAASIRLASAVISWSAGEPRAHLVPHARAVPLVLAAAREYVNSASDLADPALRLAECCLMLIKEEHPEIQEERDLISALGIIHMFNLNVLPIQVRLCEDKMSLIEQCLQANPTAYLRSHYLLQLAALLRAGGDDLAREAAVLQLICQSAIARGDGGCGAGVEAARRLAALRAPRAAPLLAHVAAHAHGHADRAARRDLYAAALASCAAIDIEGMLRARLSLELEGLQQMGVTLKETYPSLSERWPSTDDEFADAITTPVIEKKDLVPQTQKKIPLYNYLLDTFQNKFSLTDNKASTTEVTTPAVRVQEFYKSLYPEHEASDSYYRYDKFSAPDPLYGPTPVGPEVLKWFYIQNSLEDGCNAEMETEVVQKCAQELLYKDTALSVACLFRATHTPEQTGRFVDCVHSDAGVGSALYATLVECNSAELRDQVYRTKPRALAEMTLKKRSVTEEQLTLIRQCVSRLSSMAEAGALRALGFNVNGLLFNADEDYRRELLYRIARSLNKDHVQMALSLAAKYSLDTIEVWLQHAVMAVHHSCLSIDWLPPERDANTHDSIYNVLYPVASGVDHATLINLFTILRAVDDKPLISGLTAADHIKLLKKAKAASQDLNYKILVSQPSAEEFSRHMLDVMTPENVGMVGKFLRTLPPALRPPVPVNRLYTQWLTKYFFSVPLTQATSKKWMQQYRQCSSYFNKLPKDELLRFVNDTCFSDAALARVPAGTRQLMISQAVEYCQQEQENDFKFNKNEQTWAQVGQELARWLRFLENYHSDTVKNLIDNTTTRNNTIWKDIEKSHGDVTNILPGAAQLVMRHDMRGSTLTTLLRCLHVDAEPAALFAYIADRWLGNLDDMQHLVHRLTQFHKEGIKFSEDYIDRVLQRASELGLPPHKQIGLLALSSRTRVEETDDMTKVAKFSLDLFKTEWPDLPFCKQLTEESLLTEEGRRTALRALLESSETLHQRKALVDVLACWPPVRDGGSLSLHCEYLQSLLNKEGEVDESLVYIKMLLRRPLLTEQEMSHLISTTPAANVVNLGWVVLLNKGEAGKDDIIRIVQMHEETVKEIYIDGAFIKELLKNNMLIPLVPTVLYNNIVDYIVGQAGPEVRAAAVYDVRWATHELARANCLAEAGNLYLLAAGVPASLRTYSDTVNFCRNTQLFFQ